MPISPHIKALRARVGSTRLLLPSVSGIVYDDAGRILLVRQIDGGIWSTPGGVMEPDETPAEAVVREVWEETGLRVVPARILGVFGGPTFVARYPNGDETQFVMTAFECLVMEGAPRPDGEETSEVRFIGADEYATLPVAPWTRDVLPLLYARPERALYHEPGWRSPSEAR